MHIFRAQAVSLPQKPSLKEESFPLTRDRKPVLSYYTDSAEYYFEMHQKYVATVNGRTGLGYEIESAHSRRIHAQWGLIARGVESIPYVLQMLASTEADSREDAAGILMHVGKDDQILAVLLRALSSETGTVARDSLIVALGQLRNPKAIPALSSIIRDPATDGDTRWTAVESLGKIAQQRFLRQTDPIQKAIRWLDQNEHP